MSTKGREVSKHPQEEVCSLGVLRHLYEGFTYHSQVGEFEVKGSSPGSTRNREDEADIFSNCRLYRFLWR